MTTVLTIIFSAATGAAITAFVAALVAKVRQDRSDHATVSEFAAEVLPWFKRPGPGIEDLSLPAQIGHLSQTVRALDGKVDGFGVRLDSFGVTLETHVIDENNERPIREGREKEMRGAIEALAAQLSAVDTKVSTPSVQVQVDTAPRTV